MTNNNLLSKNNSINNTARSKSLIKLNMQGGKLTGNLLNLQFIEPSVIDVCSEATLNLSCEENSQYLPLI